MLNREQLKVVHKITELLRIVAAPYCIGCRARMKGGSGRWYCKECDFGLASDNPWCVKCRKRAKAFGVTRDTVQRWLCNYCCTSFLGSRLSKSTLIGTGHDWIRKVDKLEQAIPLFRAGMSIREVEKRVGIAKHTAAKYRRIALRDFDARCQCGQPVGHKGFCWYRYQQSPKRQEFMRRWHWKDV